MKEKIKLAPYLDPESQCRVQLVRWLAQKEVSDLYIERPKSLMMVLTYLWRVGLIAVINKIKSRLAEKGRNKKMSGVGLGVLESGKQVVFFSPSHSDSQEVFSVDSRLLIKFKSADAEGIHEIPTILDELRGWSPMSGIEIDESQIQKALEEFSVGPVEAPSFNIKPVERVEAPKGSQNRPTAVLFGFGNYAKTQIIPNIKSSLHLDEVHEIDPDQLQSFEGDAGLDTSPWPRSSNQQDVWFVAGFHSTHAPIAREALKRGAYAVVEKPLATTWEQFKSLRQDLVNQSGRGLFICFHKRYSKLNDYVKIDLGLNGESKSVDMHALVYQIPLPKRHWYNWPSSGSRMISNGCHWLDYFIYMNNFSKLSRFDVTPLKGSDFTAWVTLENGAQLTMSLTDTGSERLGVRDIVELRAGDTTVKMTDGTYYQAENSRRVLRRTRVNPMSAYQNMYQSICEKVKNKEAGDSLESLYSTEVMLMLEERLQSKKGE